MTISKAVGCCVGMAEEVTYGTAVGTPTKWMELVSQGIKQGRSSVSQPTLRTRSSYYYTPGKKTSGGPLEFLADYGGGIDMIYKHALGTAASSVANGDGCYTHTITCSDSLPVGLTVEVRPDGAELGKNLQFAGCRVGKLSISGDNDKIISVSADFVGDGSMEQISANTASFPTFVGVDYDDLVLTLNSTTVKCHKFKIDVDNALEAIVPLGQLTAQCCEPKSPRKVSGSFDILLDGTTQLTLFTAQTEVSAVLTFTGPTAAGATEYKMTITVPRLVFSGETPTSKDDGPIMLSMPWEAHYDITNSVGEVKIEMVNKVSTV